MAAKLEQLAKYYASKGYLSFSQVTASLAKLARESGMPDYLPDEQDLQPQRFEINPEDIISEKAKTLTPELAKQINQRFGKDAPDTMSLDQLILPLQAFHTKHSVQVPNNYPFPAWVKTASELSKRESMQITAGLNAFRNHIIRVQVQNDPLISPTLAFIRYNTVDESMPIRNLGVSRLGFLKLAFRKATFPN